MQITTIRRAGLVGAIGGALSAASGLLVAFVVQPASTVSDEMWSFPWSSDALVPVSLLYALFHAMVFYGILGFGRSGVAGSGRAARIGTAIALAGTAVLLLAELLTIPIADQRMDDSGAELVGGVFGLGTALSAIGFVVAGIATVRARRWAGWRRFVPLAAGVWLVALVGLALTPAIAIGVAVYSVLITALGYAVMSQPSPSPVRPRSDAVKV